MKESGGVKRCWKCEEDLPVCNFNKGGSKKSDGLDDRCRSCGSKYRKEYYVKNRARVLKRTSEYQRNHASNYRDQYLKREYGIGLEEWKRMFTLQKGLCGICGGLPCKKGLCVDHDHKTGKVRGLLCTACNTTLGMIKESKRTALAMYHYIKYYEKNP